MRLIVKSRKSYLIIQVAYKPNESGMQIISPTEISILMPSHVEELIVRAMDGETAAFEELINLYKQPLWSFVYRLLGNYEDTNDTIQQILIQVYVSLPALENYARFYSWLFAIARNKCTDQLRHKARTQRESLPCEVRLAQNEEDEDFSLSPLQLLADPTPLPDELIERRETQQLLQRAIATLPERQRQVVALRYTTDMSFSEIGEVLGLNANTAKTLFLRAKNQLRFYLKQHL